MRTILYPLSSILALLLLCCSAPAGDWRARVYSIDSRSKTNRAVDLRLKNPGPTVVGPWLLPGDTVTQYTDTNGTTIFSNVLAGDYVLTIRGTPVRSYPISIFDTNGLVDFATYIGTTNSLQDFYTAAQVDALLDAVGSGGGGSGESNVLASVGTSTSLVAEQAGRTNQVKSLAVAGGMLSIASTETNVTVNLTEAAVRDSMTELGALFNNRSNATTLNGNVTINESLNLNGDQTVSGVVVASGNITTTGGQFNGSGAGLTALPASQLTGTIDDARLPSTITSDITGNAATSVTATNGPRGFILAETNAPTLNNTTNLGVTTATNITGLLQLTVSNSVAGEFNINRSGNRPGVNTEARFSSFPPSSGMFAWLRYLGALFTDSWGAAQYNSMTLGDQNFRGLMLNEVDYANPYNHLTEPGVAVSANALAWGGSGAALTGQPIKPSQNEEMLDYPPVFITTWDNTLTSVYQQPQIEAQLQNVATNGLLYAFTNQGMSLYSHIDDNALFLTNNRIAGDIAIDTSAFPSGTNFLWRWQTNGVKFSLTMYLHHKATNDYYLDLSGEVPAGTPGCVPASTPVTYSRDITKLYSWGLDMYRGSDLLADSGYHRYWINTLADRILNPSPTANGYTAYWKDRHVQGRTLRPMAFLWMTPSTGRTDPAVYGQANLVGNDHANVGYGIFLGDFGASNSVIVAMNHFRSYFTNQVPHLRKGHYGDGFTYFADAPNTTEARLKLTIANMVWGSINLANPTNTTPHAHLPIVTREITNVNWISLRKDLTGKVYSLFDNGYTNTSGWARQLAGGDYAVFLSNESNNTANVTYDWGQLGAPVLQTYQVSDMWNQTNIGVFSRSHTLAITATNHYWLRLTPVVQQTFSFNAMSPLPDAALTRLNTANYSPAPHYYQDGFKQTGGTQVTWQLTEIPDNITNLVFECKTTCEGISTWTNRIEPFIYWNDSRGRDGDGEGAGVYNSNIVTSITAANAVSNFSFTVNFPAASIGYQKMIAVVTLAPTNTTNPRYFGVNAKVTMR